MVERVLFGPGGATEALQLQLLAVLTSVNAELQQKLEAGQDVGLSPASLAALENVTATVSNWPVDFPDQASQSILTSIQAILSDTLSVADASTLTNAQLRAQPVDTQDTYVSGQALAAQAGPGLLTFSFSVPMDLIWVMSVDAGIDEATSWADPFGGTPSAGVGIPCLDRAQQPITVRTTSVKVWAAPDVTVAVWGYRYA